MSFSRRMGRADNELLYGILDQLAVSLFAFISIMRSVCNTRLEVTTEHHGELLDALKSKKPARISHAVRGHFVNSYDDFLNSDVVSLEEMIAQRAG
jgi:DNA-binding GntR family transcriptional regulator